MFLFFIFLLDPPSIRCYIKSGGAGGSAGQGSRLHRQPQAPEVCKAVLRYNKKLYENYIDIYTYKRVVCVYLFACLSVFFLSATRHLSTLRRCLRVAERAGAVVASGPARAGKRMHSESTRAHAVQLLNEKVAALMPFKNKTVRARMLSYT